MAGKNFCNNCKQTFGSLGAFDMHRVGSYGNAVYAEKDVKRKNPTHYTPSSRLCITLDEIQAVGMMQNERGWWIIGGFDGSAFEEPKEEE